MSTPTARPDQVADRGHDQPTGGSDWDRLVIFVAAAVALVDIVFVILIGEILHPLTVAAVITAVGIAVMPRRRRVGLGILGVLSLLLLAASVPFAGEHLGHPESGVDWAHTVIGVVGRIFVVSLVVVAWRGRRADASARLVGAVALGLLGVIGTVALLATAVTSGDERQAGDVELIVDSTAFPEQIVVTSGDVLFVDNVHIFRHTFVVEGTDIDVELPALQAVRIPIDLPSGSYSVICDIPGHEKMTSTLVVE
jgi:hypothetical protein